MFSSYIFIVSHGHLVIFYLIVKLKNILQLKLALRKCPYSELFWSAFSRIRTECGEITLRIQSEWGKMQTRITPNRDTFHAV